MPCRAPQHRYPFLTLGPAQVASCLLILAFFYDIFWVFISSHIFGQNVMVRLPTTKPEIEHVPQT